MSSSFFSSSTSEQRWANQFNQHFIIYFENSPSIFRVPKRILDTKPGAYAPKQIGLGAYHHFRPELDDEMESKKLEVLKKFLRPEEYKNFKRLVVDKVKELEQCIRACYNNYLDVHGDTLAWIMAIDGTYLLYLLSTINSDDRNLMLSEEILKLENQIPGIVLKKIVHVLSPQDLMVGSTMGQVQRFKGDLNPAQSSEQGSSTKRPDQMDSKLRLLSEYLSFCKAHSPLELSCDEIDQVVGDDTNSHLLAFLYNLIMNNWAVQELSPPKKLNEHCVSALQYMASFHGDNINQPTIPPLNQNPTPLTEPLMSSDEDLARFQEAATLLSDLTGFKPLMVLARLPLREGIELYKHFNKVAQTTVEEIEIPSVSQLHGITNLEFEKWTGNGIGIGIKYKEQERALCLPVMHLNTDSEVILRNLKAYEEASASQGSYMRFSEYLDFMCGIIDTAKDVQLLRDREIIVSKMENEEIAQIFNGMSRSNGYNSQKAVLKQTVEQLNKGYDDSFRIRIWRSIKQQFIRSQDCIRVFVYILVVLLLGVQAVCDIYGCSSQCFLRH